MSTAPTAAASAPDTALAARLPLPQGWAHACDGSGAFAHRVYGGDGDGDGEGKVGTRHDSGRETGNDKWQTGARDKYDM
jgi:hypothetical protein